VSGGDLFALPVPPTPPAGLPSSLLERRPDIRAAEQTMIAANAQIGVARAARFPSVTLTPFSAARARRWRTSRQAASGGSAWASSGRCSTPAGARRSRISRRRASSRRSRSWQRSVEGAFREVSDALVNLEETGNSEAELRARVEAARNALELSRIRYESGYSPYLEVLDAQRTANDAEIAFVRNRQARLAFSVDLMRALGGGWKIP
jgi:multidrug efflux system outer membrane protein